MKIWHGCCQQGLAVRVVFRTKNLIQRNLKFTNVEGIKEHAKTPFLPHVRHRWGCSFLMQNSMEFLIRTVSVVNSFSFSVATKKRDAIARKTAVEVWSKNLRPMKSHKNSYLMLFYDLMWICVFEFIMITGMGFCVLSSFLRRALSLLMPSSVEPKKKNSSISLFCCIFHKFQ